MQSGKFRFNALPLSICGLLSFTALDSEAYLCETFAGIVLPVRIQL